jgi:hypothetical protein
MIDAERAVASLVGADPTYIPSPTVASPKVLQLVSDMRRKELPGVARKLFEDGRTAFKDKAFTRAQRDFELLLDLLEDPALKGRPESDDLRVLAEGFVALADASAAPPAAPAAGSGATRYGRRASGRDRPDVAGVDPSRQAGRIARVPRLAEGHDWDRREGEAGDNREADVSDL